MDGYLDGSTDGFVDRLDVIEGRTGRRFRRRSRRRATGRATCPASTCPCSTGHPSARSAGSCPGISSAAVRASTTTPWWAWRVTSTRSPSTKSTAPVADPAGPVKHVDELFDRLVLGLGLKMSYNAIDFETSVARLTRSRPRRRIGTGSLNRSANSSAMALYP